MATNHPGLARDLVQLHGAADAQAGLGASADFQAALEHAPASAHLWIYVAGFDAPARLLAWSLADGQARLRILLAS